jgi:hypothetical protein
MSNVKPPVPANGDSGFGAAAAGAGAGGLAGAGAGAAMAPSHDYKYGGPANHPGQNAPPMYPPSTSGYYANTGAPTVSSEAQSDMSPPGSVAPAYYQQPNNPSELHGSTNYAPTASTNHPSTGYAQSSPQELGSTEIGHGAAPQELPTGRE